MNSGKILLMVTSGCLVCFCGCQQECVTKKDSIHFPIIISAETDRVCNGDGTLNVREKGGACILSHWKNDRTYDANGVLVRYDDQSGIWPFYNVHAVKTESNKRSSGTILLFFSFSSDDQFQ
ncbi:MAG: hypothetical protein ABFR90_05175 [Planctomycetota bacterium]